jgi:Protein of unknown function (DUF3822)
LAIRKYDIVEDTHSKHIAGLSRLSILIGMDSFSYIVCDNLLRIQVFRMYSLPIGADHTPDWQSFFIDVSASDELLTLVYKEVCIGFAQPLFSLVPEAWYRPGDKKAYLEHLTNLLPNAIIGEDSLPSIQAKNVYYIPTPLQNWVQFRRTNPILRHFVSAISPAIRGLLVADQNVVAYLFLEQLFVFYFLEGRLVFANSFKFTSAKDVLYYVLLVFDQFKLSQDACPLWLGGIISPETEIYKQLYKYIHNVQLLPPNPGFNPGPKISQLPASYYFAHTAQLGMV